MQMGQNWPATWASGPSQWTQGRALGQRRRWQRPGRLRLADSGVDREVVLGRLGNAAHPSGESGQGGPHRKNELHGDVWSTGGGGVQGWWSVARSAGRSYSVARCSRYGRIGRIEVGAGYPRRLSGGSHRAGRSYGEGPEGLSGPKLEGSQRCTSAGWSSRRRRSGRAVAEGEAIGGPGCGRRRRHGTRGKQRRGMSERQRSKRGSSSVGHSPYNLMRRWTRAAEPVGDEVVGAGKRWRSARGSDQETDTRGPRGLFIIPQLSKPAQH
jgi:hypothetical protein